MNHYDVIVLGLGGMGLATASALARRGGRVLGLEQFSLGHDKGSSHGQTRIIRKAYFEHPDYVPLVSAAYERWYNLEQRQGIRLLTECPCLSIGPSQSALLTGVRESANLHRIPIETLNSTELRTRFPEFHFEDSYAGVLEGGAGILAVEDCIRAYEADARKFGAELHEREPVLSWDSDAGGVTVQTTLAKYHANRLVITAGPWAGRLLHAAGIPLTVMRQVSLWFQCQEPESFRSDRFPIFIADTPDGYFYGFPMLDPDGLKIAQHYGAAELTDPKEIDREILESDETPVRKFLSQHLPGAHGPRTKASVCVYTMTPDKHFVIDRYPGGDKVPFAAGFSGHGFKFAPIVGEILADLAETGRTAWPIELFRTGRFP